MLAKLEGLLTKKQGAHLDNYSSNQGPDGTDKERQHRGEGSLQGIGQFIHIYPQLVSRMCTYHILL
jgi:hypothetical protein